MIMLYVTSAAHELTLLFPTHFNPMKHEWMNAREEKMGQKSGRLHLNGGEEEER
jgi:hypothetical protein